MICEEFCETNLKFNPDYFKDITTTQMGFCNSASSLLLALTVAVCSLMYFRGRAPQNHYEALGLYRTATAADIKSQFRRVALRYHPDKNPGDESAIKRFHALVEARDTLLDPERRQAYDAELDSIRSSTSTNNHQQRQQQQQQQQREQNVLNRNSWECETATCWWFTYFRDTLYPYLSMYGMMCLIFYLGLGTIIIDWLVPKAGWFLQYVLCYCLYPMVRSNASRKAEVTKNDDMRARMRQRWLDHETRSNPARQRTTSTTR